MDMSIYDGLKMRHKRQIDTKDFIRTVKSNLFNNTFPSDIPFWSPKDGDHLIDFVPWIAGKDMPLDRKTGTVTTREGEIEYVIDVDVHCRIGPASLDFICPKQNFGKRCPICEYLRNEGSGSEEAWKKYKTTRRTFYLVWVHDTPEDEAKGLQLWNVAHFFMENKLQPLATLPRGGGYKMYSHPTEGSNISFTIKKKGMGNIEFLGHALYDREQPIPQSLLDRASQIHLDETMVMHPSYDEIKQALKEALECETAFSSRVQTVPGFGTEDDVPFAGQSVPNVPSPQSSQSIDWYDEDEGKEVQQTPVQAESMPPYESPKKVLKRPLRGNLIIKKKSI